MFSESLRIFGTPGVEELLSVRRIEPTRGYNSYKSTRYTILKEFREDNGIASPTLTVPALISGNKMSGRGTEFPNIGLGGKWDWRNFPSKLL